MEHSVVTIRIQMRIYMNQNDLCLLCGRELKDHPDGLARTERHTKINGKLVYEEEK